MKNNNSEMNMLVVDTGEKNSILKVENLNLLEPIVIKSFNVYEKALESEETAKKFLEILN